MYRSYSKPLLMRKALRKCSKLFWFLLSLFMTPSIHIICRSLNSNFTLILYNKNAKWAKRRKNLEQNFMITMFPLFILYRERDVHFGRFKTDSLYYQYSSSLEVSNICWNFDRNKLQFLTINTLFVHNDISTTMS